MRSLLTSVALLCLFACNNKKSEGEKKDKNPDSTIQSHTIKDDPRKINSIVGIWGPSELNMKQEMSEEEVKNILQNATIEFTASGNYISQFNDDRETGTYKYNEVEKTLVTKKDSGNEERFSVAWDNGLLRLTMEDGTMVLKRK